MLLGKIFWWLVLVLIFKCIVIFCFSVVFVVVSVNKCLCDEDMIL